MYIHYTRMNACMYPLELRCVGDTGGAEI